MQSTNPRAILTTLQLVRAGLASGLLCKEELIDWADEIVTREEAPDIFFIDLLLSSSKSTNDVLHYINDFLNFEEPVINGRPLLGLLYKKFHGGEIDLEQTVSKLFRLKFEALFTEKEEGCIYSIDDAYDCAKNGIYGTIEDVHKEVVAFLSIYKGFTLPNFEKWVEFDKIADQEIVLFDRQEFVTSKIYTIPEESSQLSQREGETFNIIRTVERQSIKKPWWKFW